MLRKLETGSSEMLKNIDIVKKPSTTAIAYHFVSPRMTGDDTGLSERRAAYYCTYRCRAFLCGSRSVSSGYWYEQQSLVLRPRTWRYVLLKIAML